MAPTARLSTTRTGPLGPRGFRAAALAFVVLAAVAAGSASAYTFPHVPELRDNVEFWKKVYAVWSVNDIAYHDPSDLSVVYRVVRVPARGTRKNGLTRAQAVKKGREEIVAALASLDKKRPRSARGLNPVEAEVFAGLAHLSSPTKYRRGVEQIRAQNGLRERFIAGYKRAGAWERLIKQRLKKAGLPEEVIALAYVESLMDNNATSHAGAAGMWQFMRPTAKEYMQVHHVLDERRDPFIATDAAAKYLLTARKNVGPWPCAITSYNYGRSGMKRAMKAAGSSDFGVVLRKFKSKRFGFAARNYYASFLAVADVLKNPARFFGRLKRDPPWRYDLVRLPFPALSTQLLATGVMTRAQMRRLNPAWTKSTRKGQQVLPRGIAVRIPKGKATAFKRALARMSDRERMKALRHVRAVHRVKRRRTSLARVARIYGVPLQTLARFNGWSTKKKLRRRMKVRIPSVPVKYSLFFDAKYLSIPEVDDVDPARLARAAPPAAAAAPAPKNPVKARGKRRRRPPSKPKPAPQSAVVLVKMRSDPIDETPAWPVDLVTSADVDPVGPIDVLVGDAQVGESASDAAAADMHGAGEVRAQGDS